MIHIHRKYIWRIVPIILAAALLFCLTGCQKEKSGVPEDPQALQKTVEEMAMDYGTYDIHGLPPLH